MRSVLPHLASLWFERSKKATQAVEYRRPRILIPGATDDLCMGLTGSIFDVVMFDFD